MYDHQYGNAPGRALDNINAAKPRDIEDDDIAYLFGDNKQPEKDSADVLDNEVLPNEKSIFRKTQKQELKKIFSQLEDADHTSSVVNKMPQEVRRLVSQDNTEKIYNLMGLTRS